MTTTARTGKKQLKRERQRAAAEARGRANRRRAQRRSLALAVGAVAVIAASVLVVVALQGDPAPETLRGQAIESSRPDEVSVSAGPRTEPLQAGESAPSFTAPGFRIVTDQATGETTLRRETVAWSPGEPTVVSVWAPWCPHCQAELPILARVAQEHPNVTFVTVVTSIGTSPGPDPGAFLADHGITIPTAIDDTQGALASAFGIQGFPTLYFVGADGVVAEVTEGEVDEESLRRLVDALS